MYDILIVGGGTAGLTAAIYARRAGRSVLLLEGSSFGGQITSSPLVENYPGLKTVSGLEYADRLTEQAEGLGTETVFAQVSKAEKRENYFVLQAGKKTYEGRTLIVATGAKARKLGVSREEEFTGRGVSYCAVCDGAFFAGKDTAVVGGGDSALQAALFLANRCRKVYLIHRRREYRAEPVYIEQVQACAKIQPLLERRVTALQGEATLTGLELTHVDTGERENLSVSGIFVAVGQEPDNTAFASLVDCDPSGYICAGEDCITKTPGVFAAGDCRTKPLRQLTTAAADGSTAAMAASSYRMLVGK